MYIDYKHRIFGLDVIGAIAILFSFNFTLYIFTFSNTKKCYTFYHSFFWYHWSRFIFRFEWVFNWKEIFFKKQITF